MSQLRQRAPLNNEVKEKNIPRSSIPLYSSIKDKRQKKSIGQESLFFSGMEFEEMLRTNENRD